MLKNYGLVKGKIKTFETENKLLLDDERKQHSQHYNLSLNVNNKVCHVNINIFSKNKDFQNLKIYCPNKPNLLNNKNVFMNAMKIKHGIYFNLNKSLSIDYLRGNYFDLSNLKLIDDALDNQKIFLYHLLDEHLKISKKKSYDVVVWGQIYKNFVNNKYVFGIHDVHMNQGNQAVYPNGVYQDGLIMIHDKNEIKFICFLAFSNQCIETNEKGHCFS